MGGMGKRRLIGGGGAGVGGGGGGGGGGWGAGGQAGARGAGGAGEREGTSALTNIQKRLTFISGGLQRAMDFVDLREGTQSEFWVPA